MEGLDIVRHSTKPFAFISTRDHLSDGILRTGFKSYYLPPETQESTLTHALMAIALQKKCKYKKEFNEL